MRKRVQEGDAQKQTNLKKILLDNNWFAHAFPTSTYTQKGRQPYLF